MLTQSLWFSIPALVNNLSGVPLIATLPFSLVWVSVAHSAQYLWVTAYYERRSRPGNSSGGFLWRCLLTGSALVVVPSLLLSSPLLGSVAWDAGLAIVLFSVVNLHHFLLDGAIWKLRDGRVARALLQTEPVEAEPLGPSRPPDWRRWLLVPIGVVSLLVGMHEILDVELNYSRAGADADRARAALDRLRWTGRDSPSSRLVVAQVFYSQRRFGEAKAEVRRSLELRPTLEAWTLACMRSRPIRAIGLSADLERKV